VGTPLDSGWTTLLNGGAFGTDYLTRTAVAKSNVFVNRRRETAYYFLDVDAAGERLRGDREYRLTFPSGKLPPARGFWSLTVYDERHALPEEADGRHSIGSRTQDLEQNPDGSLTITIGPPAKPGDPRARRTAGPNRLTAPTGSFSLYLRLYWPTPDAVDGAWSPPALAVDERAADGPGLDTAGHAPGPPTSQDLAISLTYDEFAGRSDRFGTAMDRRPSSRSLTGQLGGAPPFPLALRGGQGGPDVRVP
jgi:hypothetical protein